MAQNIVLKGFKTAFYISRGLHSANQGHAIVIKGLGTTHYLARGLGRNVGDLSEAQTMASIRMSLTAGGTIGTIYR